MATSQAILAAAEETIVERGLTDTGIAEIAARAGVAVGTVYNHFEDREALLAALMAERGRELLGRLDEAFASAGDFRARLDATARGFLQHVELHYGLLRILLDPSQCPSDPEADQRRTMHQEIRARIEKLMRQGSREGALRRDNASLHAALFLGMIKGVLLQVGEAPEGPRNTAALASSVTRIFVEGAGAR